MKTPALRCVRCSPNGQHIAVGDVKGRLHVYDAETLKEIHSDDVHDGEIAQMDYSCEDSSGRFFLATGGNDGIVRVFLAHDGYRLQHCLEDHGAPISGVRFADGENRGRSQRANGFFSLGIRAVLLTHRL